MYRSVLRIACGVLACSSCEGEAVGRDGVITGTPNPDQVRVEYGRHWLVHGPQTVAVGADGAFRVPSWSRVATAFVDANRNERLDAYSEPTALCELTDGGWRCDLNEQRLTILRVESGRVSPHGSEMFADNLTVILDAYTPDGGLRTDAQVCLADGTACSIPGAHVLGPSGNQSRAVAPCAVNAAADPTGVIGLDVRLGDASQTVRAQQPSRLTPTIEAQVSGDDLIVRGTSVESIDRIIAWIGNDLATQILWSTEVEPRSLVLRGNEFELVFPAGAFATCLDCKGMIQGVHIDRDVQLDDVTLVSEIRLTVELRN